MMLRPLRTVKAIEAPVTDSGTGLMVTLAN